ncbi:unnamed protein product [Lampetra planeri]
MGPKRLCKTPTAAQPSTSGTDPDDEIQGIERILLEELRKFKEDIKEMKEDIKEMKEDMREMKEDIRADIASFKGTVEALKSSIQTMEKWKEVTEQRITRVEDANVAIWRKVGESDEKAEAYAKKVEAIREEMEKYKRRNNVRLVGLKEGKENADGLVKCVEKILLQGDAPRTALIRFLRPAARDAVLRKAREKRGIQWEDCKLSFFEDVSREVMGKRKEFLPLKKKLEDLGANRSCSTPQSFSSLGRGEEGAPQHQGG